MKTCVNIVCCRCSCRHHQHVRATMETRKINNKNPRETQQSSEIANETNSHSYAVFLSTSRMPFCYGRHICKNLWAGTTEECNKVANVNALEERVFHPTSAYSYSSILFSKPLQRHFSIHFSIDILASTNALVRVLRAHSTTVRSIRVSAY